MGAGYKERMEMMVTDLEEINWDVVAVVESWREEKEEMWKTKWGHTWCGGGGMKGKRGTGFLIHTRWTPNKFEVINERLSSVSLKVQGKTRWIKRKILQ